MSSVPLALSTLQGSAVSKWKHNCLYLGKIYCLTESSNKMEADNLPALVPPVAAHLAPSNHSWASESWPLQTQNIQLVSGGGFRERSIAHWLLEGSFLLVKVSLFLTNSDPGGTEVGHHRGGQTRPLPRTTLFQLTLPGALWCQFDF